MPNDAKPKRLTNTHPPLLSSLFSRHLDEVAVAFRHEAQQLGAHAATVLGGFPKAGRVAPGRLKGFVYEILDSS